ncbi:MAG: CRISPR-associated protein Cas5 [Treponema sp.]|jgi:CRISPR-associated protein Cas5d|nr:CRISPR-associated protein Cas5 [Treponema sp.]
MACSTYTVMMEIAGDTAMWTRPDTGDCPVSLPAPTYSAVKAIFESILLGFKSLVRPTKVELCAPLHYHSYHTNYGGPLRQAKSITEGNSYQLLATVLIDVCYRLYAEVSIAHGNYSISEKTKQWDKKTTSPAHAYQDIFNRRLKRGQCYAIPFLGWKEFTPSYFGVFRESTRVQSDITTRIPSMVREVFSGGYNSQPLYTYDQDVVIANGVLTFATKDGEHDQ